MSWTFSIEAPPALQAQTVVVRNPDFGGSIQLSRPQGVGSSDGGTIHVQDLGPDQLHIDGGWTNLIESEYLELRRFFSRVGTKMQLNTFKLVIAGQCQQPQFVGCGDVINGLPIGAGDVLFSGNPVGCGDTVAPDSVTFVGVRLDQPGITWQDTPADTYTVSLRFRLAEE